MKKNLTYQCSLVLVAILCASQGASGQYKEDALRFSQFGSAVGARPLGMGNTVVAMADDYSALFGNPAGLTLVRSYEVSAGLSRFGYKNDLTFFEGKTNSENSAMTVSNAGLVYPIPTSRGSLTFGAAFGRVADYTTSASFDGFNSSNSIVQSMIPSTNLSTLSSAGRKDLLDNNIPYQLFLANVDSVTNKLVPLVTGRVQQTGTVLEGGGMNNWSFGGALDLAKDISVGVSFNVLSGNYSYYRKFEENDVNNVYADLRNPPQNDFNRFTFESTIKSDLTGFNALFGLMVKKQGRYRLGLTVRTPTTFEISEKFTDEGRSRFDNGDQYSITIDNTTKYKVVTPFVMSGGLLLQVFDWLSVSGDAEYVDWTQVQFDTDNLDLLEENRAIKRVFRATTNLRGGAEVTIWDLGIKLRGGIALNPSPYLNDPKDFDQLYYTAGIGLILDEHTTLNAGYSLGWWKTYRDNYYIPGGFKASTTAESVNSNNANVTLSYRF